MFQQKDWPQKFATYGLGALALLGAGYVGAQRLKPAGDVVIQNVAEPPATPAPVAASAEKPPSSEVIVHVSGAVKQPGVLHLPVDARVVDAVKKAGEAADADLEQINLAAKLEDGTVVYVPHKEAAKNETPVDARYVGGSQAPARYAPIAAPATESSAPSAPKPTTRSGRKQPAGIVTLSTASMEQLETLPGIGPATAQKILDYRMEHGGFRTVEELLAVKGIGPKKMEKLRPHVRP